MIKMVIADDEVLTLDMMACIIDWAKLGIEIVGKAVNGQEALDMVRRENPEILLTDIQMPMMDGIELLKVLSESHPQLKSIILSAYGEFQYAKEAIRYGASGFLVKPIDELELEELIASTVKSHLESKVITQEAAFRKLLSTRSGTPALLRTLESEGIRLTREFRAYVIQTEPASVNDQLLYLDEASSNSERIICALLTDLTSQGIRGYVFEHQDEEWICIAERAEGFGSRIAELLLSELGWKVVVGVSGLKTAPNDLHDAYNEALDGLGRRFLFSSEQVFEYDQLTPFGALHADMHHQVYKQTQALLEEIAADPFGRPDWRGKLSSILHEAPLRPDEIYSLVFSLLIRLRTRDWEHSQGDHEAILPVTFEAIKRCKTLDVLLDYLASSLQQLAGEEKQRSSGGSDLIRKAKAYIQAHYNTEISLESICAHIAVSKNYFSSLFKKETGMNIWDYLTSVRLEQAKRLLTTTSLKNYEIASRIGYENPSYFTKMFKKSFGQLPQEYRIRQSDGESIISS